MLNRRFGAATWPVAAWLLLLQLLLLQVCSGSTQQMPPPSTAYLVDSMQQSYEASNSSFNSLRLILSQLDTYNTIVLTEDYTIGNNQEYTSNPVRLTQNLLITSAPGGVYQMSFSFLSNAVLMNNYTVTLRNMAVSKARKTSGQLIPFFSGEGVLALRDVVRVRIACTDAINATASALRATPRPPAYPGVQQVSVVDFDHRDRVYPNSVRADDMVLFVSPGDVEDAAYYAGYSVAQNNVTRVCDSYVPRSCNEQCLLATVDGILAAQANAEGSAQATKQLVAIVVPAVVCGVVLLAVAVGALFWQRRRTAAREAMLRKYEQDQQAKFMANMQDNSGGPYPTARSGGWRGPSGGSQQILPQGPGVPVGLLGRPGDMGVVGSIEEVAIGAVAENGARKGWHLMACHTAPEFPEATAKDAITLGVLLGAGSFGRVYKGRWRGMDVAVKVLHHDINTAATVANEVDLVMSFRHPNITTAYHFLTWNYSHETGEMQSSESITTRATPDPSAASARAAAIAAAAAAAAAASDAVSIGMAGSSAAAPETPLRDRQLPIMYNSTDVTSSSGQQVLPSNSSGRTALSVIQSQSLQSSAQFASSRSQIASTAGGSRASSSQQQNAASPAEAAAGLSASGGALYRVSVGGGGSSSGRQSSSSAGALPVHSSSGVTQHISVLQPRPHLHNLSWQGGYGPSAAAAMSDPRHVIVGSNGTTASTSPLSAAYSSGAGLAAGVLVPDAAGGPSWGNEPRLMPVWGPRTVIPQRIVTSSTGGSTGAGSGGRQSIAGSAAGPVPGSPPGQQNSMRAQLSRHWKPLQQDVEQSQSQQQQQEQVFVPMVPYTRVQQGDTQQSGGTHSGSQQQQQHLVPLVQQQHSSNSTPSHPSQVQQSGQFRQQQLQRTARFDPGSDGSSYAGTTKARAGEAQTWLILEYCDGGTLLDIMQDDMLFNPETGCLNLPHVITLLADVAAGMNYLHLRNCVHGDLKPANVLLKKQQGAPFGHVTKVSDFGLSKSLTAGQSHRSTRTLGTFNRAPPELLRLGRLSPACDVYAFGIMIWELITGQVAFSGLHYGEVFERVALLQERPPVPVDMPEQLASLMVSCWGPDPLARPTFRVIQQSLSDVLKSLPDSADRFIADL